jgi:hypothetical protein
MPRLHKFNLAFSSIERAEHAIDAVARITKNPRDAPLAEPLNQKIAYCRCHLDPRLFAGVRVWTVGRMAKFRLINGKRFRVCDQNRRGGTMRVCVFDLRDECNELTP